MAAGARTGCLYQFFFARMIRIAASRTLWNVESEKAGFSAGRFGKLSSIKSLLPCVQSLFIF